VFGWQSASHYHAVLVNGAGYAEAYTQRGAQRQTWFAWQQWPHILYGNQNNRLRIDVRGASVTARINDEVLAATMLAEVDGRVGVLARGAAPGQVVFSWVRLWAAAPSEDPKSASENCPCANIKSRASYLDDHITDNLPD
jgi:hypothetical protein